MNCTNWRLAFWALFPLFLLVLLPGCEQLLFFEKEWSLSGDAEITGVNNILSNVKLAAFYIDEKGGNLTAGRACVSEIRNLGTVIDNPISFDLTIDVSAFDPLDGDEVQIYMWEDSDADNAYDDGEDKTICVPDSGCAVFNSSSLAAFFFMLNEDDYDDGWYLNAPAGVVPVEDASLDGALLINNSSL